MKNINVQSFDDGFGDNKCDSGKKIIRIPTVYDDYKPMPSEYFNKEVMTDVDEFSDNLHSYISYHGSEGDYIVGDYALRQSMSLNWYGGNNKHDDFGFPIIFKTCLGLMSDEESSVVDLLVMGLPCNSDNATRIKKLEDIVIGHHNMSIVLSDGVKMKRDIHVKNLIVKKQPFGSFCDVLLDDQGKVANKDLANSFTVVVDIGSRTLNIYTINRMEEINDLIETTNNGIYTAYLKVGDFIENKMNFSVPTGRLPIIIKEKTFNGYDLSEVIDRSYMKLSYEIKKVLDTMLINSYGYVDNIIFTGGGSEILKNYLSTMFYNFNIVFLDRYATARGLRKYGLLKAEKMLMDNKIIFKVGDNNVNIL